jgi:hypothetical protein
MILGIMAMVCGIVDSVLEHRDQPMGALWLYGADRSGDNPSINGLVTFIFALITYVVIFLQQWLMTPFIPRFFIGSKILCLSRCTSQLSLYGLARRLSFTLIPRCIMKRPTSQPSQEAGTCQMTLDKSNIFFRTRREP